MKEEEAMNLRRDETHGRSQSWEREDEMKMM